MIIVVGEILFDVFPDYKRPGGAPFNFACHLLQMGFPVRFISRVGDDADGREILRLVRRSGLNPEDIQIDPEHPTGHVRVTLDSAGVPEFDIVPDVAYDYIELSEKIIDSMQKSPDLVYFGTLARRQQAGFAAMQKMFELKQTNTIFFYDVNLRPDCYTWSTIQAALPYTDILKLNGEELDALKEMIEFQGDVDDFIRYLFKEYRLTMIALTRGAEGSALFTGNEHLEIKASVAEKTVDTVGAGDAFAAVLAAGFLKKRPLPETLEAASSFAADICTIQGAVPDDPGFYKNIKGVFGSVHGDFK